MSSSMASSTDLIDSSGNGEMKDVKLVESTDGVDSSMLQTQSLEENERKARVDAMWEKMNKGVSVKKTLRAISNKTVLTGTKDTRKVSPQKNSSSLMTYLGLAQKKTGCSNQFEKGKQHSQPQNETSDEAKRLAAAALAAVKDASALASASSKGKVEIREVRDFAGQDVEIKKLVDANSKEASEKAKVNSGPVSAVDAVLEQIKKKQKLSVLDKTKKDWGEYKEEHKGVEDELDTYKKSSNQYIDKLSFLQRADYREFERERDARLATHAGKRKSGDMQEDDDHP
ncbi:craniofacial development protein 1 [Impatiens glandulifera]|uniref:craniofacial development protein 1 n=1 Tax=Impatiens glandulifera TaxID=253017 RepID=UPI001FB079A2|nr:craniofacial development protein 1 [Impatiens glandulifera]